MEENKIDFIKWVVGYAEGFEMFDGDIKWSEVSYISPKRIWNDVVLYPLLLQRAIEGYNRPARFEPMRYVIDYDYVKMGVYDWAESKHTFSYFFEEHDEDKAKEAALLYVYEQEKNK